jgi:hypothetical protein
MKMSVDVDGILDDASQRIREHGGGLDECDVMLPRIQGSLPRVPSESHPVSVTH